MRRLRRGYFLKGRARSATCNPTQRACYTHKMQFRVLTVGLVFCGLAFSIPLSASAQTPPPTAIISPASGTYAHADDVLPMVAFASTSRIVDVEYLLSGKPVAYDEALPFFELPLGTTTFSVVVRDVDGAVATTSVVFTLTATPESLQKDIRTAEARGLITKTIIRDRMIRSLELFDDAYTRKLEVLSGSDRKKEERVALLNDRMQKLLDSDLLDLVKKQEGRTIKKPAAAMLRAHIEALRARTY